MNCRLIMFFRTNLNDFATFFNESRTVARLSIACFYKYFIESKIILYRGLFLLFSFNKLRVQG